MRCVAGHRYAPNAQLWIDETASFWGGGRANVSDTFASGFWYLDQLGYLATAGRTHVFARQTLVQRGTRSRALCVASTLWHTRRNLRAHAACVGGGACAAPLNNYGLIQYDSVAGTYTPNPDFHTAVLWKRLVGTGALEVDVDDPATVPPATLGCEATPAAPGKLRVYAFCGAGSATVRGDTTHGEHVTVVIINMYNSSVDVDVSFGGGSHATAVAANPKPAGSDAAGAGSVSTTAREEFHLTSSSLTGRTMMLNGRPLVLDADGKLPALTGRVTDAGTPVTMAPLSYAFVVLPLPPQAASDKATPQHRGTTMGSVCADRDGAQRP